MRKPFQDARLLWEEIGCVVTGVNSTSTDRFKKWTCTEGTITSKLASGNTSMRRYQNTYLPRYDRDGFQQFEYIDERCTDGDFRNYDGDFQEDFFNKSNYLELRIYNRTSGEWMRSHAWGDMPERGNPGNSSMVNRSAQFFGSYSRMRPIFLMNPDGDAYDGAVNMWEDFYSLGDIIDFKLYDR
jgi:hypothetical protein